METPNTDAAVEAGELVSCERTHDLLWHYGNWMCPACEAIERAEGRASEAEHDREAERQRRSRAERQQREADDLRLSAERSAREERSKAEDLEWRRRCGRLHAWER